MPRPAGMRRDCYAPLSCRRVLIAGFAFIALFGFVAALTTEAFSQRSNSPAKANRTECNTLEQLSQKYALFLGTPVYYEGKEAQNFLEAFNEVPPQTSMVADRITVARRRFGRLRGSYAVAFERGGCFMAASGLTPDQLKQVLAKAFGTLS